MSEACAPGITFRLMSAVETMPSLIPMTAPSSGVVRSRGCGAAGSREAEEHDLGDVLGGHHPLEDVGRATVALAEREVRRDSARADVGAADAVLAQLVVERAREPDLAELRRAVDGFAR